MAGPELGSDLGADLPPSLVPMSRQTQPQMPPDIRPFGRQYAEHVGITDGTVAPRLMMTQDAVTLRTQPLDRSLRREVEVVSPQANHLAAERVERVLEEQELAGG